MTLSLFCDTTDRPFRHIIENCGNLKSLRDVYSYGNNIFINFQFL